MSSRALCGCITEFYEPVEMRRGDSAYYDGSMGHNVISVSDEDATILWVTSLALVSYACREFAVQTFGKQEIFNFFVRFVHG